MNKKIDFSKIDSDLNLKKLRIKLDHIVVNPDKRVYAIMVDEDKNQSGIELNSFEASMLSFAHKGFHKNSHINTIYQLFIKSLSLSKVEIEDISVESKYGDIIYCTLKMVNSKYNRTYSVVTMADALILSTMYNYPLYVMENVWENFDRIDEWDYEDFIVDFDQDDTDD